MSSNPINGGGPAFPLFLPPSETGGYIHPIEYGMSLRDWLAGQALAGLMARDSVSSNSTDWVPERVYAMADAMIEARSKRMESPT